MSDDAATHHFSTADSLFAGFVDPPRSARARVWWHWMDGNIDPAGIVEDLEWLAASGAGGVQAFTGSMGIPQYTRERVTFRSPEWQAAISCAASTSTSLGLELAVATSAGWSATGGPWVAPHAGMKKLVWSTTGVTAGQPDLPRLAAPPSTSGPFQEVPFGAIRNDPVGVPDFYDDVAVLAFPRRDGHFPHKPTRIRASGSAAGGRTPDSLADGRFWPTATIDASSGAAWVMAEFEQPTPVSSVRVGLPASRGFAAAPAPKAYLEASPDGITFSKVSDLPASGSPVRSASFPTATARFFRLVLQTGHSSSSPGRGWPGLRKRPATLLYRTFTLSTAGLATCRTLSNRRTSSMSRSSLGPTVCWTGHRTAGNGPFCDSAIR